MTGKRIGPAEAPQLPQGPDNQQQTVAHHRKQYSTKLAATLPPEMLGLAQWVCHRAKVPYDAKTRRRASTTNRATWATFDEALRAYQRGGYDGLGIVLADGLAGTDIDHCRDSQTGELQPWAVSLIDRHGGGYVEASPSGTGIHVLYLLPTAAECGNKTPYQTGAVEMYSYADGGRFFTVTGAALDKLTSGALTADSEAIAALRAELFPPKPASSPATAPRAHAPLSMDDSELLTRARNNPDGAKAARFRALYDTGDASGYKSQSEADAALCNDLAYMCGPGAESRVADLFRRSALYREKADRDDYVTATVALAYDGRTAFYTPKNSGAAIPFQDGTQSETRADGGEESPDLAAALARIRELEAKVTQLERENAEIPVLRQACASMNEKLFWTEQVKELPKEVLSQSEKDLLIAIQREFGWKRRANVRESGCYPTCRAELGEIASMGKNTAGTHLTSLEKMKLVIVERYEEQTSKGPREHIAVRMAPAAAKPQEYTRPDGPRKTPGGPGNRAQCRTCGSEDTQAEIYVETAARKVLRVACHSDGCGAIAYQPLGPYYVVSRQIDTETAIPFQDGTQSSGAGVESDSVRTATPHVEASQAVPSWNPIPPQRPCIRCRADDWRYDADGERWYCGSCSPVERQVS